MHSRRANEDSDSDSLIDYKEIFSPPSKDISVGDIVWAKYKYLYWPALVRAEYPNQKKISIWYCDDPGKTFKLPKKNVYAFNDETMRQKILKDVKEAGLQKEHEGLTSHAAMYLSRKNAGYKDDPRKFFDQTYPFFLVEEMLKKDPTANVSDIKIRPMYLSHEKKQIIRKSITSLNNESDDSDLESTDSDCETKPNTNDYVTEMNMQLKENTCDSSKEIDVDEVIEYILSGKVDNYLQGIKSKKIPSEHRDMFDQSIKNKRKNVNEVTFTGPITDDSKLRKLIFYLIPLHKKIDDALKNKNVSRRKRKSTSTFSCDNESIGHRYVASVFLPESIIFAISKIKNISLADARQLFIGKSECRTKAVESLLACCDLYYLNKNKKNASESIEKSVLQHNEHHKLLKHSDCTELKIGKDKVNIVSDKKGIVTTRLKSCEDIKLCKAMETKSTSSYVDDYEERVVNCILSGKADDYLKNVKLKCVPSSHFDRYEQTTKSGKKKLSNITYTGPVKNDDKVKLLMFYLLPLYHSVTDTRKSSRFAAKKCKSALTAYNVSENNPIIKFVIYVWLPESISFAISEIESVILPEAKKLFDEYAETKSVPDILKSLDQDFSG